MPRVHFVKKARKDNPVVEKGESYYWWKFAFGTKQYSKIYPKRSLLTQSGFLFQLIGDLENLKDECQESLDNMPEHLQDTSNSGIILTERIENLNMAIDEISSIDIDMEDIDCSKEDRLEQIIEEIGNVISFE